MSTPDERAFRADIGKPAFRLAAGGGPLAPGRHRLAPRARSRSLRPTDANTSCASTARGYPQAAADRRAVGRREERDPALRPLAAQQGRAARHRVPPRLERRHRAVPALRPRKHRRPRQLAPRNAVENLAARRRASFNTWSSSMNFSIARLFAACWRRGMSCPARGFCGGALSRSCASAAAVQPGERRVPARLPRGWPARASSTSCSTTISTRTRSTPASSVSTAATSASSGISASGAA